MLLVATRALMRLPGDVQCNCALTVPMLPCLQIGEGRDVIVIDNAHDDGGKKKGGCCS